MFQNYGKRVLKACILHSQRINSICQRIALSLQCDHFLLVGIKSNIFTVFSFTRESLKAHCVHFVVRGKPLDGCHSSSPSTQRSA
ncbi:Uncharacterised protein [Serratia marcescens]|nr:Uncharacterised protein [Serratia marcescens]CVF09628.1 Uncharacterised protein [Serratia marcescens]CVH19384.1 Uncharacterised protein [Serratia marcescens]